MVAKEVGSLGKARPTTINHRRSPQIRRNLAKKGKGSDRDLFPDYGTMSSGGPDLQSSSSASSSAAENQALRKVVKALAEANSVDIPPEVVKFLQEDPEVEMRTELKRGTCYPRACSLQGYNRSYA